MPRRSLPVLLAAVLALQACGSAPAPTPESKTGSTSKPTSDSTTEPKTEVAAATCPDTGFDCDFQSRFTRVEDYVKTRPGTVGIVVRDRETGAVWHNDHSADLVW